MNRKEKREKRKRMKEYNIVVTITILIATLSLLTFVPATPTGPSSINVTANETATSTASQIINISGGYIATLNVTATMQNPHWKAFVGEIDGRFTLDDASGSTIYDWTLSSVTGEIYATRNSSTIEWGSIACANSTHVEAEDATLAHTGEDNINETFNINNNSLTFVVAGTTISASSCYSTNTYVDNQTQEAEFEEVILYDDESIVFATVLEEDEGGFDGNNYDFQMIVPENGSDTWTSSIAYYIYVELS